MIEGIDIVRISLRAVLQITPIRPMHEYEQNISTGTEMNYIMTAGHKIFQQRSILRSKDVTSTPYCGTD